MEKECTKCCAVKPLSAFSKAPTSHDGLRSQCRPCRNAAGRKWKQDNRERAEAYQLQWRRENPDKRAGIRSRHNAKYPERLAARKAVSNAIRDGRLVQQPCGTCGGDNAQAHHESYAPVARLDVMWLCLRCHRALHAQNTALAPTTEEKI